MTQTIIKEDAVVLIPNAQHKNFTETSEMISAGTEVKGDIKLVNGLRKGEPFIYRLFQTDDNKLIFLNKTNIQTDMQAREVTLGATGDKSIVINETKPKRLGTPIMIGAIAGAIAAGGFAKYKGKDMKNIVIYAVVGAAIGYIGGYMYEKKGISVKINK